jgi:hypothetical protein
MRRTSLLLALMTLVAPVSSGAQDTLPLAPGARVRVSAPDLIGPGALIATVVAMRRDTLVLRTATGDAPPWTLPLERAEWLEVSRGRRGRGGQGALIGLLTGVAVGGLLGAALSGGEDNPLQGAAVGIAVGGGLVGFVVGGVIGSKSRGERWEPVPLPGRASSAPHTGRAAGVHLSLTF